MLAGKGVIATVDNKQLLLTETTQWSSKDEEEFKELDLKTPVYDSETFMDKVSPSEELINDNDLNVHQKVESKRIYNSRKKDERQHEFAKKRKVTLDSKQKLTSCEFEIASLFSELDQLIYPLVNRDRASQELAKQLILQKINNTGVLPILNEQCGVGKTSLVINFRKVLENNQLKLENISEKHPDVVKSLMKAVLVRIDMKIIYGANHNSDLKTLFDKNGHGFK